MRISARADYAVRAALMLAAAPEGVLVSSESIATAEEIPASFLEGILTSLRRAGIAESRRGANGGFRLARDAASVSIADVVRAVDGPLVFVRDSRPSDLEYTGTSTGLLDVWVALRASVRSVLEETTLAAVVGGDLPEHVRLLADDPSAWRSPDARG
ncbi:RrF2 family transcriptional regulator [Agromyces salentinus]|uniref:RrF2 family transcriptional regulator n=1 Tax=Agromyces salentinus TaxID=269421 RepID=A0ABP4Z664_9MICO|nr:Rrf2 family transcriptional regulator [Agromyces salentinus]